MRNFPTLYVIAKPLLITYLYLLRLFCILHILINLGERLKLFYVCLAVHILFIETITIIAQVM